jgi:diaminohydroxyphosphoribosylaminopyrimidine deaminase/5-amino-6-(5-phosphoribosylamino)uracil reductase
MVPDDAEVAGLMRRAAALAAGRRTHPNPTVGCLVLDEHGLVVGEGHHAGPGHPHAEAMALAAAGSAARGGTAIVTLEPCVHHGRTPPCADALVAAGVARVVVGAVDPDPRVAGAGLERLVTAGIDVRSGILADEMESLDPAYFHHRRTGRPRVTLKLALTLDGAIAAADGSSRWITGPEAREDVHRLRASVDAVVVGAGTLRADDPSLDVRLPDHGGPQPRPVVLAGADPLPGDARLAGRALVVATSSVPGWETLVVPGAGGRPDLGEALVALGDAGLLDLLVEGGATVAGALWRDHLVDRGVVYVGARVGGGRGRPAMDGPFASMEAASTVQITGTRTIGPDVRIDFERI